MAYSAEEAFGKLHLGTSLGEEIFSLANATYWLS